MKLRQIVCNCGCDNFRVYMLCDDGDISLVTECSECNERMVNIVC